MITGARALEILQIAHKYCMDGVEKALLKRLGPGSNTEENVNLMVAGQIIGSDSLCQQALEALIASDEKPDIMQAKRIGAEAIHAIMMAKLATSEANKPGKTLPLFRQCSVPLMPKQPVLLEASLWITSRIQRNVEDI
jgi:hypothetical protein